jgi:hypothetical protein
MGNPFISAAGPIPRTARMVHTRGASHKRIGRDAGANPHIPPHAGDRATTQPHGGDARGRSSIGVHAEGMQRRGGTQRGGRMGYCPMHARPHPTQLHAIRFAQGVTHGPVRTHPLRVHASWLQRSSNPLHRSAQMLGGPHASPEPDRPPQPRSSCYYHVSPPFNAADFPNGTETPPPCEHLGPHRPRFVFRPPGPLLLGPDRGLPERLTKLADFHIGRYFGVVG